MPKKRKPAQGTNVTITGDVKGQVAVGENITQIKKVDVRHSVTPTEMDELHQLLKELRAKVAAEAEPQKKDAAIERIDEFEKAVTDQKPDLSTMEYVRNWFGKNLPTLAGAVTSVVVHPIVGKLVEAGGDLLVKEFQRRFGDTP